MSINLEEIRQQKGVSLVDMADLLGVKYQTIREKIDGKSSFKFEEAEMIKKNFFPEYEIEYLFTRSKKKQTTK